MLKHGLAASRDMPTINLSLKDPAEVARHPMNNEIKRVM